MSTRYFKVIKENFLWEVGAILSRGENDRGYDPIEGSTIWNKNEKHNEYISTCIVENCPEYFQEVWKVNLLTRSVYKVKAEALALINQEFNT